MPTSKKQEDDSPVHLLNNLVLSRQGIVCASCSDMHTLIRFTVNHADVTCPECMKFVAYTAAEKRAMAINLMFAEREHG